MTAVRDDVRDDVALALRMADQADALTMGRFGALDLSVDTKPDLTPVTDADRSVETALRETLSQRVVQQGWILRRCRSSGPMILCSVKSSVAQRLSRAGNG